MSILPKAIYKFHSIPVKLPIAVFKELEQIILQFLWRHKRLLNSQGNFEKENAVGRAVVSDFVIIL